MSKPPRDANKIFTDEELQDKLERADDIVSVKILDDDGALEVFTQIRKEVMDYPAGLKIEICEALKNAAISILGMDIPEGETLQ